MSIYVSSSGRHAALWRSLRAAGLDIAASWIDEEKPRRRGMEFPGRGRDRRLEEAASADTVLIFEESEDSSTVSLLEAGAALAAGKRVISVGPNARAFGREGHPAWTHCKSLTDALRRLAPPPQI